MRVLLPILVDQVFPREQAEALRSHCDVETSFEAFWENRGQFDIVQLNWPEELTQWREPTDIELLLLKGVLQKWRKQSRIVVTRHNFHPHYADTERYRKLYDVVYAAAHVVVHMGEFSRRELVERYAGSDFVEQQIHEVIPHPVFSSYPDRVDRAEARKVLEIGTSTFVLLAFGRVQSAIEKNIVVNAFLSIPYRDKVALVPGWRPALAKEPVNRFKWMRLRNSRRFRFGNGPIPDEQVAAYFRAADLAIIPRENVLNSGVISLCVKFDCPTVAPKCGNITELALAMNSTLFDPSSTKQTSEVVKQECVVGPRVTDFIDLRVSLRREKIFADYCELYRSISLSGAAI